MAVLCNSFRLNTRSLNNFMASDTMNTVDDNAIKNIKSIKYRASVWKILWNGGQ